MKLHVINATAAPTDPAAYELAIRWLIESGYQVVFVGREPFPALFATLGVLNYSESPFANYRHDIQLFATSSVAITAGSGISAHPDCMGKPYVYLDSWHLGMPMPSRKCVSVPALMKHRKTGRFLNLAEQLQLYMGSADKGGEAFPSRDYEARNAEPEEILQALQEALSLAAQPAPLTQMQQRFHKLIPATFQPLVKSRMSDFFLKKHNSLLPG
jgi:putative glycosyltransferase (TIGR04372 family)